VAQDVEGVMGSPARGVFWWSSKGARKILSFVGRDQNQANFLAFCAAHDSHSQSDLSLACLSVGFGPLCELSGQGVLQHFAAGWAALALSDGRHPAASTTANRQPLLQSPGNVFKGLLIGAVITRHLAQGLLISAISCQPGFRLGFSGDAYVHLA
jgi:hypothetical protein